MSLKTERDDGKAEQELRDLDGIVPAGINRRKFLGYSVASLATVSLAGCMSNGNSGGNGGGNGGGGIVFRNTWDAEPDYAPAYVADRRGFWKDQGLDPGPTAEPGNGSGDTAQRIGTGTEMLGGGGIDPVIGGLIEGYELTVIGGMKTRGAVALMYTGFDDPMDLEGRTILVESAYEQDTLPMLLDVAGVSEDQVDIQNADPAAAYGLLADGDADAIWGTMGNVPAAEAALSDSNVELSVEPLYKHNPVYGYVLYANNGFIESDRDYVLGTLQGYSHALGWTILNPGKAVDFMREEVNDSLQVQERKTQVETVKVAVLASNLVEEARKNGLCYIREDTLQTTYDELTKRLDLGDEPPNTGETFAIDLLEEAELRMFSSDEWNKATENCQRYLDMYQ